MSKVNSLDLSMPQSRTVRGYEIRRLPLGAFLQALKLVEEFPPRMMETVFPDMTLPEILLAMSKNGTDMLWQTIVRAIMTVPEQTLKLVARLTQIPVKELNDDVNLGLDGLAEIADAWYEVNRIENFFVSALGLYHKVRAQKGSQTTTGSST